MEVPIKAVPKASHVRITPMAERLKVCVTAAPEKGKANAAVEEALEEYFGGRVRVIAGAASPQKTVLVSLTLAQVLAKLPP